MDKLTAIKIKNPDGSYSTPIAISALAQNVLYGDGVYSVKDILDSLDARIDNITAVGTDGQLTAIRVGADNETYATARAAIVANDIKNRELVLVKDTQPTETWNKLWLDTSDADEQRIISTDDMANIIATYYNEEADYAIGDYVIHEDANTNVGKLYKCKTAITGGQAWTTAHWNEISVTGDYNEVFQSVNDQIDNLKSIFDEYVEKRTIASPVNDWEQGQFGTTTGSETSAINRIRTVSTGIPKNVKIVNATNGYKFLAYAWSGSEYLGIWTGEGFNKSSASGLVITSVDLRLVYSAGASKVRLVLMRSTVSENILPSEGTNLVYTIYENYIPFIKDELSNVEEYIDAVKVPFQSGNLYQARTEDVNNRYYYRNSSGVLSVGINTDYIGFIVPVVPHRTYTFTRSNLLLLKSDKTLVVTTGGNYDVAGVRTFYSGEAHYFAVSVRRADIPESGYVMSMGDALNSDNYALKVYANPLPNEKKLDANMVSGSLANGETHYIYGQCGVRDGYFAAFHGKFSSFGTVTLKFNGFNVTNAVSVNETNLVIVNGVNNTITQPHGLTIANEIGILFELKNSVLYVTVISGGIKYTYNCTWYWTGSNPSEIGVTATDMSFTDTTLSLRIASAERNVWYFGDSYAEFNMDSRLPYYMIEYGFDKNVLFNSISGASSNLPNVSITTLLAYGKPKYAINATGMNDGSDSGTTPNAGWLERIQTFITLCERHNIIPVLCTVPTIPSVNNNGKNAWVKASGYRYIDMAGAVGADGTGTWYTGMLGTDNIHPSPLGAVAQFMQLLTDMPEVM